MRARDLLQPGSQANGSKMIKSCAHNRAPMKRAQRQLTLQPLSVVRD